MNLGRWRLATRLGVSAMALLLLLQLMAFVAVRATVDTNAREGLRAELEVGQRVWQQMLAQRAAQLQQGAAVLAADFGFREAVATQDESTLASALSNHGERIGATVAAVLAPDFSPRATSEQVPPALRARLGELAASIERAGSAVLPVNDSPHQFVMVPMRAPLLIGWVIVGFELDAAVLQQWRAVTGQHASLWVRGPNSPAKVRHSTLAEADAAQALQGVDALRLDDSLAAAGEVVVAGEAHLFRAVALDERGKARVVLAGSVAKAAQPYLALQRELLLLTAVGLLMFGVVSVWLARRITEPLGQLARASKRMAQGDIDTPLPAEVLDERARDEVSVLARSFEQMRGGIAEQQRQIRRLAYWDSLTGLPNRVQFRQAVAAAVQRGLPHAVLMLDLDRFKHVNDVLGYAFGDLLLQGVAQRLRAEVRPDDLLGRLAGDEFALLLHGADEALALAVAERVTQALHTPLQLDDQCVDLSAGIGVACFPVHARETDDLISCAERAMYAAKHSRASALMYDQGLDNSSAQTLSLLSELRRAVEHDELRLFLQPKLALADGRVCGAEALVRWQHPQRGLVPPMQFIPFAEQTGFIRQLTLWVVQATAAQWETLAALGLQRVSLNLSTRDLMDGELPEKLDQILERHGMGPRSLCLEITESAIMDDPQRAEATLNRLAERGYKLSIDDFGTGYSSLAYLKRLPVEELKIDKSFVMGLERDAGDAKIVRSTIDLAHNLGLSVVAEGVENAQILQRLAELGCDEAQGYHLSRPVSVADFCDWVVRRPRAQPTQSVPLLPAAAQRALH
jgi:diguanylate cyclase (GGDEF)-like protein